MLPRICLCIHKLQIYYISNKLRKKRNIPSATQSFNMPTKMAKFYREKRALITTYEEKPRWKTVSPSQHEHQHHYHLHHHHHHYLHHASAGKQYSRRAELLRYSERLRESARPTLLHPYPTPPNNRQPATKGISVHRKKHSSRTPNYLGNWKIFIPSFIRSLTSPKGKKERKKKKQIGPTTYKMKALMKSFQVKKKSRFIPHLCSLSRKQHR